MMVRPAVLTLGTATHVACVHLLVVIAQTLSPIPKKLGGMHESTTWTDVDPADMGTENEECTNPGMGCADATSVGTEVNEFDASMRFNNPRCCEVAFGVEHQPIPNCKKHCKVRNSAAHLVVGVLFVCVWL